MRSLAALALLGAPVLLSQSAVKPIVSQPALLTILQEELERNFQVLKTKGQPPAYYLAYEVTEEEAEYVVATAGVLQTRNKNHMRQLDITLRLGTPQLDNYHQIRGDSPRFTAGVPIALDDTPNAIKQRVWLETDRIYRLASQRLINIQSNTQVNVAAEDKSDDFSPVPPTVAVQTPAAAEFATEEWAKRAKKWSGKLSETQGVLASGITVIYQRQTKSLVSSEGAKLQHGREFARVLISAQGKASDGMDLATSATFEAQEPGGLPNEKVISAAVEQVGKELDGLLRAPLVEPYVGPAVLSGKASGVYFHEIFGHRVEGHRQKDPAEGQTFTKMVNTKVLPDFLSVVFDPTRRSVAGTDLNGYYLYDDEGVAARPVTAVDHGILKTFLLSRSPIQNFPQSNGHGRRQAGLEVVSRQSNLIVESAKQVPEKQLRQMLIDEAKRQGKPYGLYFQQVTGGYTQTQRRSVQAYKVLPVIVYRIWVDGRPDELVRGADIVGTPLAGFARIMATSDRPEVFNGYCGAESGSVPVSAVSPAILVSEVEIVKRESARDRPPLLAPPAPEEMP